MRSTDHPSWTVLFTTNVGACTCGALIIQLLIKTCVRGADLTSSKPIKWVAGTQFAQITPKGTPLKIKGCLKTQRTSENEQAQIVKHFGSKEVPMLRKLLREESGQDMIEYALLASFISIVAIAALRLIGPLIVAIYEDIQGALT